MKTEVSEKTAVQSFEIRKEVEIAAPIEIAFETVLETMDAGAELPDGKSFSMKIEPWVGGRWYRDLGEMGGQKAGHLWGHVQVIKAPGLLEICGPLMMSFPAANHLQYRLKAEGGVTKLTFVHRGMGLIPPEQVSGMNEGWGFWMERIRSLAEKKAARSKT